MPLPVHILFGTETGNAQDVAERLGDELGDASIQAEVIDMGDFDVGQLASPQVLLIITSTYGNGDPPANAKELFDHIHSDDVGSLEHVQFSVLALGDSMHRHFCQCGKDFDTRLEALGARRIAVRVDCDTDYDELFEEWMEAVVPAVREALAGKTNAVVSASARSSTPAQEPSVAEGVVSRNINLNGAGSEKHTRHVEVAPVQGGLEYVVGDRVAVYPQNSPALVDEILAAVGLNGEQPVTVGGVTMSLRTALLDQRELTTSTRALAELVGRQANDTEVAKAAKASEPDWRTFSRAHDAVDLLLGHAPKGCAAQALCDALEPMGTRLYSIASSPAAHGDAVHITVDVLNYERHGRARHGTASQFFAERAPEGTKVRGVISPAPHFRLAGDDVPIIMIGPGTGVAPFRGFLAERVARGAKGRNWLFFGSRHAATDFLYGGEFRAAAAAGKLTRLDLAFSRDQPERIYVQQRMWEARDELHAWLEDGAHVYVCGDATNMAVGVEEMFGRIAGSMGGSSISGTEFCAALRRAGRYHLDVY